MNNCPANYFLDHYLKSQEKLENQEITQQDKRVILLQNFSNEIEDFIYEESSENCTASYSFVKALTEINKLYHKLMQELSVLMTDEEKEEYNMSKEVLV